MEEITKDEVFEVLSSSRRRLILYHLHRRGGEAVLRDLASDTAEAESEDEVDDDIVKRFYISLYQTHVPKLEEVGLVRYDSDTKTVSLTDRIEEVEAILETESEPGRRWPVYYGALAIVGSALAVVQLVGIAPPVTSVAFAAALLLLAAFQYYETEVKQREYHFLAHLVSD
ncbi:hypothetical protein DJ82_05040 [Halorubrum sp. Ib24]|uniref:DUF7344 domain-containing protein n=1 Tax=unclassified Halorubrum TaxID=2642239 RepID=UPI000B99878F|nr:MULTISPECIES: hypothetical protein [unclassified Halorubrum]OYR41519.1 hypothetical protein DJ82_05040 [Halorubrum sp. Ib24]OYR48870.1 hypothetical protein DJ75_01960 [Halorubrum sp. Eb13]